MSLGDNTNPHPLQVADARQAAHRASEIQRGVEDQLRTASRELAEAERQYRLKLTLRILHLHAQESVAWTACEAIAKGEREVADLRYARDVARGVLEAAQQQAYRYAADRRDLHRLIEWSMRRELRVDVEPGDWSQQQTYGAVPDGVDPKTGEIRDMPRAA